MIIILTRSLCLVGCCGSFRWVRGFCLLVTQYSSHFVPQICFCDSQTVPNVFPNMASVSNRASVRQQQGVPIFLFVVLCWCVYVMEGQRESSFWFRVLLAEELHSSLGILELYTDNCKVLSNRIQTHVWSHLRQFCTGAPESNPAARLFQNKSRVTSLKQSFIDSLATVRSSPLHTCHLSLLIAAWEHLRAWANTKDMHQMMHLNEGLIAPLVGTFHFSATFKEGGRYLLQLIVKKAWLQSGLSIHRWWGDNELIFINGCATFRRIKKILLSKYQCWHNSHL